MKRTNHKLKWIASGGAALLLLLARPAFGLDPSMDVHQFNCQTWTRQNGFSASTVNQIVQSRGGYLWLGTERGLIRFDGNSFDVCPLPESGEFRSQIISTLAASRNGGVWFGVRNGSIGRMNGRTQFSALGTVFPPLPDPAWISPDMNVISALEASDGALWIGSDKGLARCFRGDTNASRTFPVLGATTCISEDSRGRVWIGTADHGLFYWQAGTLKPFPDPSLASLTIFALAVDNSNRLWIGSQNGLRCYNAEFQPVEIPPLYTEVRSLLVDREGALWIGTTGDGLLRYKDGAYASLRKTDGLAGDNINALCEDTEGNLWVGTRNGLTELSDVKLPIISAGFASSACHDVCVSAKGGLWVGTSRGITYFDGHTVTNYGAETGLLSLYIKRVFEAKNRDLYVITGNRDVAVLANGRVVATYANTNWPTALAEDSQGVIVAVAGHLFRVNRQKMEPYTYSAQGEPSFPWIRNLFSCPDGSILVASVNGVFRLKNGHWQHWSIENGLPDYNVNWVSEDKDGVIWAGLSTGISRIEKDRAVSFSRENGLFENFVTSIVPDARGSLWVDSSRGIFRLNRPDLESFLCGVTNRIQCTPYNGPEAVKTIDTSEVEYAGCRTPDGRIWFPSPQGMIAIDPNRVPVNKVPPPAHILQAEVNGVEITSADHSPVRPGRGELNFQYTAPSFIAPQRVQFRYRLEGYDTDWVEAGTRRSAFYANLKPGSYQFVVQAANADGIWNPAGDEIAVELPPHFYQTAWFRICVAALVFTGLLGIYAWGGRHLQQKQKRLQDENEKLEQKVQKRTRQLAEQRNLLRTLIDHLPDNVFVKDTQGRLILNNIAHARHIGAASPEAAVGKTDFDFFAADLAEKFHAPEQELLQSGKPFDGEESSVNTATLEPCWMHTTKVPLRDSNGRIIGLAGINRDITERKQWEAKMRALHRQLVEASRYAGMAEVATSVLHNVGNVLNSVNVSASLVESRLKNSGAAKLGQLACLLREHEHDLAGFLATAGKGLQIVSYLETLEEHLSAERAEQLAELENLNRNLGHVKTIVSMQQTYARVAGMIEVISLEELAEDAIRIHALAFQRHSVEVVREFESLPPITADRHKVLQILVNLLHNAKYACEQPSSETRRIVVRIASAGDGRVRIEINDNGVGIAPENLTRIFSYGFTTRKNGHGFGLHSGAIAATEMGGSLTAQSPGLGGGSTFTLVLPITPPGAEHQPPLAQSEIAAPAMDAKQPA